MSEASWGFQLVHSDGALEHVGGFASMQDALAGIYRRLGMDPKPGVPIIIEAALINPNGAVVAVVTRDDRGRWVARQTENKDAGGT